MFSNGTENGKFCQNECEGALPLHRVSLFPPAILCQFAHWTIEPAEEVGAIVKLPAELYQQL